MKNIIVFIMVVLLLGFLPFSCRTCKDNFLGSYKFSLDSIVYVKLQKYNYDSIYIGDEFNDTIAINQNYNFEIKIKKSDYKIAYNSTQSFSFYNTCYASKSQCFDVKDYKIENLITKIELISNQDYKGKAAGEDISIFFKFYSYTIFYNQKTIDTSLMQFRNSLNNDFKYATSFGCINNTTSDYCLENTQYFYLSMEPENKFIKNDKHRFTFRIVLNDGKILERSTKNITWI